MSTTEEVMKLVMQVQGQDQVKSLEKQAESLRKQIVELGSSASASDPRMVALGTKLQDVNAKAKALEDQFGRANSKVAGFGQSMLQAGRGIQDFQAAGLMGVINNVEGLAMAMGGGAGLAGVLTMVGVAALLVGPHLQGLGKQLGLVGTGIDPLTTQFDRVSKRVGDLKEIKIKTSVERQELSDLEEQLARITKAKAALDRLMGNKTEDEKAAEGETSRLIGATHGGAKGIKDDMVRQFMMDASNTPQHEKKMTEIRRLQKHWSGIAEDPNRSGLSRAQARWQLGLANEREAKLRDDEKEAATVKAGSLLGRATGDAKSGEVGGATDELATELERLGGPRAALAKKIRARNVAQQKAKRQQKEELDLEDRDDQNQQSEVEKEVGRFKSQGVLELIKGGGRESVVAKLREGGLAHPDSAVTSSAVDQIAEQLNEEIRTLMAQQGLSETDAKSQIREKYRGQFNQTRDAEKATGELNAKHQEGVARNEMNKVRVAMGMPALDADGKPIANVDPIEAAKKKETRADSLAGKIGTETNLDDQAKAFLILQEQRRNSMKGITGATRKNMIARAKAAGNPFLTDEEANQEAEDEIMHKLSSKTFYDEDGRPIGVEQRRSIARSMVGNVRSEMGVSRLVPKPLRLSVGGFQSVGLTPGPADARKPAGMGDARMIERLTKALEDNTRVTEEMKRGVPLVLA